MTRTGGERGAGGSLVAEKGAVGQNTARHDMVRHGRTAWAVSMNNGKYMLFSTNG